MAGGRSTTDATARRAGWSETSQSNPSESSSGSTGVSIAEARLVLSLLEAGHVILANHMRVARRDAALGVRVGVNGVRRPVER